MMMPEAAPRATLTRLDDATRALVRLAATITGGSERDVREALAASSSIIPPVWTEELILQTYLFAGFPRGLNAMREWRRIQPAPVTPAVSGAVEEWRQSGEATCAMVYGEMYERLRENIEGLHPLLDEWMITEGYGKVLSRPGLDLMRRELCIVAACAAAGQERQLHSHLHGALNVGVDANVVADALEAISDLIGEESARSTRMLWARVRGK
jgi:4-carboxymuconolactone decarboxylase